MFTMLATTGFFSWKVIALTVASGVVGGFVGSVGGPVGGAVTSTISTGMTLFICGIFCFLSFLVGYLL